MITFFFKPVVFFTFKSAFSGPKLNGFFFILIDLLSVDCFVAVTINSGRTGFQVLGNRKCPNAMLQFHQDVFLSRKLRLVALFGTRVDRHGVRVYYQ